MKEYRRIFEKFGIQIPEILLPANTDNMDKWAVIACDQYTSQADYWKKVEEITGNTPSTFNLIFPECYLDSPEPEKRIQQINSKMESYIKEKILSDPIEGFILIKRDTPQNKNRWGLVAAIDLEKYDFSSDSKSMIRATEGTIIERIPPRVKIRQNAALELPHILVLIDDFEKKLIEPLANDTSSLEKVYDFDLMMNSGHITGYRVNSEKHLSAMAEAISQIGDSRALKDRYNSDTPFLFAIGDGNHSLATAKTIWENYKEKHKNDKDIMEHPSRWALVEIINIFSEGIEFEAIHRVIFNTNSSNFLDTLKNNPSFKIVESIGYEQMIKKVENTKDIQLCGFSTSSGYGTIEVIEPKFPLMAGTIQDFIDNYLKNQPKAYVDYIHGYEVTNELGTKSGNIGIFLPTIAKETFFKTVIKNGAFPRKTFSMGEACEKRFYVEARIIKDKL